jgi:hypothetical protein
MQHGDLDKTKVLKTKIVFMSDVRKPNSKSVLKSVTPIRPILNTGQTDWTYQRAYPPLAGFQRLWPDMSNPQPRHVRPNLIPQRLSPEPDISIPKLGFREGGRTCLTPDLDMFGFLTPQRLVFQILYKRLTPPLLW